MVLLMLTQITPAAPVTFWFYGRVEYANDFTGAMPSGIQVGTPFAGKVTYDQDYVYYNSTGAAGAVGNYYFKKLEGFSSHIQIGTHTLTNSIVGSFGWSGNISVYNGFQDADSMFIDIGQAGFIMDGQPQTNTVFELYLRDNSQSAHSSIALPTQPPTDVAFPDNRSLTWTQDDGHGNYFFGISGHIIQLTAQPLVFLNFRAIDETRYRISWPLAVTGGLLQWSTEIAPEEWHDVAEAVVPDGMENAVIVPSTSKNRFYRLVIP